jgi:hypothetical protein
MGIRYYGNESGDGKAELEHRNPASGGILGKNP